MSPSIDLPACAVRALHSGWMDWLQTLPEPIRDGFIGRCEGATFERFVLALAARTLLVSTRIEDDDVVRVGVAVPVKDDFDWELFTINGREAGVSVEWLMLSGRLDIEENLDRLLIEGQS